MHTVCELASFRRAAARAGMANEDIDRLVVRLARNPSLGDEMVGTGGCRKIRFSGRGKGTSGGFRVVTFFSGQDLPVFLITVFGKGEKANLSHAERNTLLTMSRTLVDTYRETIAGGRRME